MFRRTNCRLASAIKIVEMDFKKFLVGPKMIKLVLAASFIAFIYWLLLFYIVKDVYRYPVFGALSEMLWLPMMALLVLLPILSIMQIIFLRRNINLLPMISLIVIGATIVFMAKR